MDPLITTAARALAAGDRLHEEAHIILKND